MEAVLLARPGCAGNRSLKARANPDRDALHYFTARIRAAGNNHADMQRQGNYLDALATLDDLHTHYGHYLKKPRKCHGCGTQWMDYEEKMTDVNIAVQLLADAPENSSKLPCRWTTSNASRRG